MAAKFTDVSPLTAAVTVTLSARDGIVRLTLARPFASVVSDALERVPPVVVKLTVISSRGSPFWSLT